jgi:hypothetical protein
MGFSLSGISSFACRQASSMASASSQLIHDAAKDVYNDVTTKTSNFFKANKAKIFFTGVLVAAVYQAPITVAVTAYAIYKLNASNESSAQKAQLALQKAEI